MPAGQDDSCNMSKQRAPYRLCAMVAEIPFFPRLDRADPWPCTDLIPFPVPPHLMMALCVLLIRNCVI